MPITGNQEMFDFNEVIIGSVLLALICLWKLRIVSTLATLCIWCILKVFKRKWCEKHVLNRSSYGRSIPPITEIWLNHNQVYISSVVFPKSLNPNYPTFRLKMLLKKQKRTFPTFVFPEKPLPFSNSSHTAIIILVQGFWTQCHTIFITICKNLAV